MCLGMYYLRTRPAADPIKFTVDVEALLKEGGQITVSQKQELIDEERCKKIKVTEEKTIKKQLPNKAEEDEEIEICINCGS